jgi:hypothetical protein
VSLGFGEVLLREFEEDLDYDNIASSASLFAKKKKVMSESE